ncbi:hypothetical protein GCM10010340_52760 [Streptomyces griseoloalbus]|nr:hypothetical protein GCM10010340_52760 [Streptomyces albaduncus]
MRTARRDSLAVLLSRAERGRPISPDEAALLRAAVEAEIRESDAARTSERGQQRAMNRYRQRVEAAEAAIVEAEDERDRARAEVAQWRATYGPDALATYRAALDRAEEAEQRAEEAAHHISILHAVDEGRAHGARRIMDERDTWQHRAERAEQDRAALAAALQASRAEQQHVEAADTAALNLANSTITGWKQRALDAEEQLTAYRSVLGPRPLDRIREAEEQAATQLNRARMWRAKAIETDDRADRYRTAWQSARQRARKATRRADQAEELQQAAHQCSNDAETARAEAVRRAELAERSAKAWEATARRYAASMDDARHKADRYRLAWLAARRDRKADRAAMAAELPAVQAADRIRQYVEGVREDLRRLLDGTPPTYGAPWDPRPEVITDRATIRAALDEPDEQPKPTECEAPWHTHVETRPEPECRRSNADQEPTR